jgi:hypothetical protein
MTEFNRNQFKSTSLASIKDEQGRAESAIPKNPNFGNRPGSLKIEDGKNWRRIAPAHSSSEPAYRAKSTVFLECEVPELDVDGKETGKRKLEKKNIFIATQHSLTLKQDPILLYIEFVQKRANDEIQDKEARTKFLYPINGWRSKDGKWNWGIRPSIEYVCYAWDDTGTLGREQLYPMMLDQMKKISVERNDDNMEIIPDIFTDPDEGYPLIITKAKNDKGKWEMSCSCDLPTKKESWAEFFNRTQLTDEQLLDLMSKESLRELYEDVYTTRDFNMALDGLQRFDIAQKYEIFSNEEFLQALSELKKSVPVYKSKGEDGIFEDSKDIKKEKADANSIIDNSKHTFTKGIPIPTMKRIVKEYIAANYGNEFSLPDLFKEELIKWYDLAQKGEELPFEDIASAVNNHPVKHEAKEVVSAPASTEIDPNLAAQIAQLRKNRGSKKV